MFRLFLALLMTVVAYPLQVAHGGLVSWSPNGEEIAYIKNIRYREEIFMMDADGGKVERLTHHPGEDIQPAWLPDGAKLMTSSRDDRIYIHDVGKPPP